MQSYAILCRYKAVIFAREININTAQLAWGEYVIVQTQLHVFIFKVKNYRVNAVHIIILNFDQCQIVYI